jgi:cobalt-zinc-cadmium efflux system protein
MSEHAQKGHEGHDHGEDHAHVRGEESGHGHGHGHGHAPEGAGTHLDVTATEKKQARRLMVVTVVIALFFVFELAGAKAARSDVLEADAYHLFMDVFALGISLVAMRVASRRPSPRFTFGLRRAESMAALVNGALVLGVCVELVRDALSHLSKAEAPRPTIMLAVASAALVVNGISAWLLHGAMHVHVHAHGHAHDDAAGHGHGHGHEEDDDEGHAAPEHAHHLNLRGAWLHLIGDALGSLAAFAAGLAIRLGAPAWVDPVASFFVVAILVIGAGRLLRDAGLVMLEAAPARLPVARVRKMVLAFPGVSSLHALHVWSLGTGHDAITLHVATAHGDATLGRRLAERIRTRFAIEYVTVQVDADGEPCPPTTPGT